MKRLVLMGIIAILFSGCAVTSEKYQYKQRMDNFLNSLNEQEKSAFRAADYDAFGKLVDQRILTDKVFSNKFYNIQQSEAITTFDGKETAHFYMQILMREFNRPNLYRLMNILDSNSQLIFAKAELTAKIEQDNKRFKSFMDSLRNEYSFGGFSDDQIISFFRHVSFAESSRKEFYYVLKILKESKALDDFKKGNIKGSADILNSAIKNNLGIEMELNKVKELSGLSKLDNTAYLDVYYNIVMKEMDASAVAKTLEKF